MNVQVFGRGGVHRGTHEGDLRGGPSSSYACAQTSCSRHRRWSRGTDTTGESSLPDFFRDFHSLAARALNAHYGRGENVWSRPGSYGNVEVHELPDLEEQLLYMWTQPVKDGLTATPEEFPGILFLPEDLGTTITIEKPEGAFFGGRLPPDWEPTHPPARRAFRRAKQRVEQEERRRQNLRDRARRRGGRRRHQLRRDRARREANKERAPRPYRSRSTLPDTVTITISVPPGYEHMTLEELRAHFRRLLDERVAAIHQQRQEQGLTQFMGAAALLEQDPFVSVGDTFPAFARNPRLASRDKERRIQRLKELQAFRGRYRKALDAWRGGDRTVVFPLGSYWLPHHHGAEVERATGPP